MKWRALTAALVVIIALEGCGGSDYSTTPTPPSPSFYEGSLPAGTFIEAICGETHQPVPGASLAVGGRLYTTDTEGRVELAEDVSYGTSVDITAQGFLQRQTVLMLFRTTFSLWPSTSPSGFDETITQELVYTDAVRCCPLLGGSLGTNALTRMRTGTRASVGLPESERGTAAYEAIREGIDLANAAIDGRVVFSLSGTPQGDVKISIDPTGVTPTGRPAAAYFRAAMEGDWITGGELVLTAPSFTMQGLTRVTAHELGHCLGLEHTTMPGGLMTSVQQGRDFSPGELALLRLAYQRPAGNVYPDSDRHLLGTTSKSRSIICVIPPSN
jgi:hypothetical protein